MSPIIYKKIMRFYLDIEVPNFFITQQVVSDIASTRYSDT